MKKFIFILVILFGISLMFSGCYTYLTLANSKLAEVPYEPYIPPSPPPDPCPQSFPPSYPPYGPIIITYNPVPDPYQRPEQIRDIRNGGDSRNSDNNGRRR